jgi:acyl-coenzyme A thioesterase PaaI-like protein
VEDSAKVGFEPADPGFEARTRASFARQGAMAHLGAVLASVAPGRVEIALPFRPELSQQHGFFHAGIISTIADTAGGYVASRCSRPIQGC